VVDSAEMVTLANRAVTIAEQVAGTQASIVKQQARSKRTAHFKPVNCGKLYGQP